MQFMILANDGWVNLPLSQQTSPPPPGLQPLPILLFPFLSLSFARWRRRKKPQCIQPIRDTHTAALSQPRTTGRRSASLTTFPSRDYVGSVAACGEYAILMQFTSNICLLMRYRPPTSILLPVTCINQNRSTVYI